MKKFENKNVLITGGNSGIGLAATKLFSENGANIAITGRNLDTLRDVKNNISEKIMCYQMDGGNLNDISNLMIDVEKNFKKIDILFLNAMAGAPCPIEFTSEKLYDDMMNLGLKGVFFTIQKAIPLMNSGSSIIVTTSITNQLGAVNFAVYAAAKAALSSLVKTAGLELAEKGIRVNAISPGPTNTPGFGRWDGASPEMIEGARAYLENKSPLKRFATPEEIAKTVLFLASEDASYITGEEIIIDGGISKVF